MTTVRSRLAELAGWCTLAAILIGPTQFSIEVAPKTFLSPVDPLVWFAGGLLLVSAGWPTLSGLFRRTPLVIFLFLAAIAMSVMHAGYRLKSIKDLIQAVEYFLLAFWLFTSLLDDPARRARALRWAGVVLTAILLLALAQYAWPAAEIDNLKVGGTFTNRNVLGGFLALTLPVVGGLLLYDPVPLRKTWYAILLIGGAWVLLSGGAAIGLGVAFGLLTAWHHPRTTALAGLAVVIILSAAPLLPRSNPTVWSQSIALFDDDGVPTQRYTEWQAARFMSEDHPLLGVGQGLYQDHIGTYYGYLPSPEHAAEPDTQNLYLVLGSSAGIPAAILFILMLAVFHGRALRAAHHATDPVTRGLAWGVGAGLIGFGVACLWSPLLVRGIGIPLAFIMALATVLEHEGLVARGYPTGGRSIPK